MKRVGALSPAVNVKAKKMLRQLKRENVWSFLLFFGRIIISG